jgi:plasmid rolling circle replication initiator protein Rep
LARNEREFVLSDSFYLTDLSPEDKPWDKHKNSSVRVQDLYLGSAYDRYAKRIAGCSGLLEFAVTADGDDGKLRLKLTGSHFCRVRHCPICQWRKQLRWRARFFEALPKIAATHPKARFLFLTLTVKNCPVSELRKTLTHMNKSWQRLSQRKAFPAIGFLKSTEITKSITGEAHPHFHCVLMVNPGYFSHGYLSKEKWIDLWKQSLQVDYSPSIDIKVIKSEHQEDLMKGLCETLKYSLKPEDLTSNREWLLNITEQLHGFKSVAVGGVFRDFISQEEPEDLITESEDSEGGSDGLIWFGWREALSETKPGRYIKGEFLN